jgi:hypothetical protein
MYYKSFNCAFNTSPRAVPGKIRQHNNFLWNQQDRHAFLAENAYPLLQVVTLRRARHHECFHGFTQFVVGHSDNGCFEQFLKLQQLVFNLTATHTLAAAFQDVSGSVNDMNETIFIHSGQIAGGGTFLLTTVPALITAPSPIRTFGKITQWGPMKTSFLMVTLPLDLGRRGPK